MHRDLRTKIQKTANQYICPTSMSNKYGPRPCEGLKCMAFEWRSLENVLSISCGMKSKEIWQ